MMPPIHHPSLELLLDYAAGSTGEAAGLALATHLALCPECREVVAQLESVGGALLEAIEPAAVPPDALDNLLARLDKPVPVQVPDRRFPADAAMLGPVPAPVPQPLRGYIGQDLETMRWKRVMRGVEQADVAIDRGRTGNVRARLLRIAPGVRVPRHTHAGTEMTLVLAGGFSDGDRQYRRGDFSFGDGATDHSPVADDDGECLCLTVTDAPLRLTGPLMRLLNPFIRF
jgi:putative transcriptional regulator